MLYKNGYREVELDLKWLIDSYCYYEYIILDSTKRFMFIFLKEFIKGMNSEKDVDSLVINLYEKNKTSIKIASNNNFNISKKVIQDLLDICIYLHNNISTLELEKNDIFKMFSTILKLRYNYENNEKISYSFSTYYNDPIERNFDDIYYNLETYCVKRDVKINNILYDIS